MMSLLFRFVRWLVVGILRPSPAPYSLSGTAGNEGRGAMFIYSLCSSDFPRLAAPPSCIIKQLPNAAPKTSA